MHLQLRFAYCQDVLPDPIRLSPTGACSLDESLVSETKQVCRDHHAPARHLCRKLPRGCRRGACASAHTDFRVLVADHMLPSRCALQYLGIPYATPPVDALRFSKTTPLPKYSSSKRRPANEPGSACRQPPFFLNDVQKSYAEDCLYLNIYAPKKSKKSLPVLCE